MRISNTIVRNVTSRVVNTKFGPRPTYSIVVDEGTFQAGFGKLLIVAGDRVDFEYETTSYGQEITKGTLKKVGTSAPTPPVPAPAPITVAEAPQPRAPKNAGVFPIPALSSERAIIRQNALTQAREYWVARFAGPSVTGTTSVTSDEAVDEIIRLARKFEAYSAGDLDMAEVKAEMEKK